MTRAAAAAGFSLVELVIALGLTLIVTATIVDLVGRARGRFDAEPEAVDRHQRVRVVVDTLQRDLLMASAVIPYRTAGPQADPPGTFREDVVTLVTERVEDDDAVRTYYVRRDNASGASQLVRAEDRGADVPVADGVAALSFAYFGVPAAAAVDPADECRAAADGGDLAPIAAAEFRDGPWCPSATGDELFDRDLSRIRRVAVRFRLAAAAADVSFDVAPRNLNKGR